MRSKKRLTLIVLTIIAMIACLVGAVACGGGAEEDAINMYILPENETLVSDDFTLPKTIGAGGAIAVTWKSDNTNAIKIEDNGGAEYDAKVTLQAEVTPVKLTISAGGASKDFTVRVDALTVYTFLNNYSFPQEKTSVTKDFDLETSTTFAGHTAQISWSVVDNDSKQYLEVVGNKAHVKPDYDLVDVKIQATFTYGTDSANTSYSFSVSPEFEPLQKVNRMYSQADYPLEFSGYIVHAYEVSEGYGNATMYVISDTFDYGYYLYRAKINTADVDKYVEGAHVTFSGGTAKNYNGLWENNSNGTVLVDDKAPIDPRDHVYAMDTDLLADVPSLLWRESTLVSLSGWKVTKNKIEKPTGADADLFKLEKNGQSITVRISKYVKRTDDELSALCNVYDTVNDGDFVDVVGILGYYKDNFQIQPILASDIKKVDAEAANTDGAKLKAAVDAVSSAVKGIGSLVAAQKTIEMPTDKDGVTISYKLVPASLSNPTVTINGGTITVDPTDSEKNYDIQVTYTLGENNYYSFFKLRNWKKTAQEIVDIVADAAKKARIGNITASGNIDLPEIDTLGATIDWSVKGGAPSWLSISGSKLTVSTLPEFESTLTFIATVSLDGAQSVSVELRAVKVSARPNVTFTALEEAKEGTYKYAMLANGTMFYATGSMVNTYYFGTTTDSTKAADFVITSVGDNQYTITVNGKYLEFAARASGTSGVDILMNDTQTEGKYWKWIDGIQNFVMESTYNKDDDAESTETDLYYLGNYSTNTSMSGNYIGRIATKNDDGTYTAKADTEGVSQWVAHFGTTEKGPDKTDQDLVNAAVADVLDAYKITVAGDWLLPTSKVNGVTFTWEVSGESDYQIVNKNALAVNQLPDTAVTVTLTLTASIEGKTVTATKPVTITIEKPIDYTGSGTLADPYTVADAILLAGTIGGNTYLGGTDDPVELYVKGYVVKVDGWSSTNNNWTKVYIGDTKDADSSSNAESVQLYRLALDGTYLKAQADLVVGAEITVFGCLQYYNGRAEVSHNPATNVNCKAVAYKAPEGGEDPTPGPGGEDEATASLSFTTDAARQSLTTAEQVWTANGITFTNTKASSTNDVADFKDPVRCYPNSTVKVEYTSNIAKIVFHSAANDTEDTKASKQYFDSLKESLEACNGVTVTADAENTTITVVLATSASSFEFTATRQVRFYSIDVYAGEGSGTVTPGPDEPEVPTGDFAALTEAKEGTFKFALYYGTDKSYYYATGNMVNTYYFGTTTDVSQAADFVITSVGDNQYTITVNGKYLEFAPRASGSQGVDIKMNATQTAGKYWQWIDGIQNFVMESTYNKTGDTAATDLYYFGNYSTNTDMSGNYIGRIATGSDGNYTPNNLEGVSQWVAHFGTLDGKGSEDETDQAKVDRALAAVKDTYEVSVTGDYALPTSTVEGVTFTWQVTAGGDKYQLTNGNALNITELPTDADVTVTLTLTATCGSEGTGTKTVTVTVKMAGAEPENKYGTQNAPISIEEALAIATAECPDGDWTKQAIYATGKLKNNPTISGNAINNFYLVDLAKSSVEILVYKMDGADGVDAPAQNDTIVIYGYIEYYQSKYEFTGFSTYANPVIVSTVRGESTITLGTHEGATVTGFTEDSVTALNGTTFEFTVTATEGMKIDSVSAYGEKLTATDAQAGKYTLNVAGDTQITVVAVDESVQTFTASKTMATVASENSWAEKSTKYQSFKLDEHVTVSTIEGGSNNGKYYPATSSALASWRLYSSEKATLTIAVDSGYELISIKIVYSEGGFSNTVTESGAVASVSGESITLTCSKKTFVNEIEVIYKAASATVQAPAEVAILPGKEF